MNVTRAGLLAFVALAIAVVVWLEPMSKRRAGLRPRDEFRVKAWHKVAGLECELAQLETVFWEPDDSASLRAWLRNADEVCGADLLEIGCGTGLISLQAAASGARHIVATDINPAAVVNASYNAERCGLSATIEVRRVGDQDQRPFAVVGVEERFDIVVSNPPWEDAPVESVAAYALYDPGFALLDGILSQALQHLKPGGRLLLVYGCKSAVERILRNAPQFGWDTSLLDERDLSELPEVFLPGMLIQLESR